MRMVTWAPGMSPGGDMLVYSSKGGNKLAMPSPMSHSAAASKYEATSGLEKVEEAQSTLRYGSFGAMSRVAWLIVFHDV